MEAMIRRAGPGDEAALHPLIREFYGVDQHPFDQVVVDNGLRPLLVDDTHGQVWLAEDETGPIGYTVVTWGWSLESGGREALLDELYVRHRGAGIGERLLRHAMAAAATAGASRMFLETEAHNARVRGFYARSGFTVEDSVWMSAVLVR